MCEGRHGGVRDLPYLGSGEDLGVGWMWNGLKGLENIESGEVGRAGC